MLNITVIVVDISCLCITILITVVCSSNLPRQKLDTLQVYPVLMAKHVKINFTIIDSNQFLSGLSVPQPANLESSQVNENLGKI